MTYSRGDIVWLRIDYLEGRLGRPHPALVLSSNEFNDSHYWGIIAVMSSKVSLDPTEEEYVVKDWKGSGLDEPTMVLPIIQSARWDRVTRKAGQLPPYEFRQVVNLLRRVVEF